MLTTKTPPSIMINKNTENFTQELNLFPIKGKNIELSFSGDRISSDGGLLGVASRRCFVPGENTNRDSRLYLEKSILESYWISANRFTYIRKPGGWSKSFAFVTVNRSCTPNNILGDERK